MWCCDGGEDGNQDGGVVVGKRVGVLVVVYWGRWRCYGDCGGGEHDAYGDEAGR